MPSYHVPVLVWEDYRSCHTAVAVGEEPATAGFDETPQRAVARVKDYLTWYYRKHDHRAPVDMPDARLLRFDVDIRPEYRSADRVYPCNATVPVRVCCVAGPIESGLFLAAVPRLDIDFYYYKASELKPLVTHYVKERLRGLTPLALCKHLPAKNVALEDVTVTVSGEPKSRPDEGRCETLETVAEPLGAAAVRAQFSRALERDAVVAELVSRVRAEKANVILVGESGIGKSSIMIDAVRQLERDAVDGASGRRFWLSSGARLIAGMRYLGEWQERCETIIEELSECGGYLCIANLLDMVLAAGREARQGLAAFFLPYLERSELRILAEATPAEVDACRRLLPGFIDVFQTLKIPAFDRAAAVRVLGRTAASLAQAQRVECEEGVAETAYRLFARFAPYAAFPGKAVTFLRRLIDRLVNEAAGRVTSEVAVRAFIRDTGLPELFVRDDITLNASEALDAFREEIIGQDAACRAATSLATTFKSGMNDPGRPIGALLFCGPTGVGKTAMAKAISRYFFGHGEKTDRLVRLDMSEYAGPGAASRLVRKPDGKPSDFIRRLRAQPFCVTLFDEIEKAAPEVFDMLLCVLDEGRLTDDLGRVTTFKSAILIMTSNLGAEKQASAGFGPQTGPSYEDEAMSFFRPEFYNRLDAVVTFRPLAPDAIRAITTKELGELSAREGLAKLGLKLQWTEGVVELLAKRGFDERYGARPLQRTIEQLVTTPLARYLVANPGLRDRSLRLDVTPDGAVALI